MSVEIRAVDAGCRDAVAELFTANGTVTGCGCMFFVLPNKEFSAGYKTGANRERLLTDLAGSPPIGLVAYSGGRAVGWCAAGPRERYARALRSPLLKSRDADEDGSVWFLPCLFVRAGERRKGVAGDLLAAAVGVAREHGATAVEGFPYAGGEKRATGEAYIGTEAMFAAAGFTVHARPSPKRVVMRVTF
ncbi:GNAT family N-acetyltransferase [Virgisporangium ochraceum]|uniref:N-acetyltransferase GCN5 n=1 Tax=Virgisporangium ochraceum TaxID=65505 RepID=A0A8J3ZV78_9ACTN|nr:GNAT family N-acetyltransferase [Virgisporangium ochraceum]GIJ70276.1 N-acetyltransferase GCN5 [Virgisporangium ochraceum]